MQAWIDQRTQSPASGDSESWTLFNSISGWIGMLNFTYRSTITDGQFNGRYAFRAPLDGRPLTAADLAAIANGADKALVDTALKHEYFHWKAFKASRVGMALIGRRFWTRVQFLRGNFDAVDYYYRRRFCYFRESYDTHEQIVKEMEAAAEKIDGIKGLMALSITDEQREAIRKADRSALSACRHHGTPYRWWMRWLDAPLGRLACREFGLQAYVDLGSERPSLHEVSLKSSGFGFVNAATETRYSYEPPRHVRALRWLFRALNVDRWFGRLTKEKLALWALLRSRTVVMFLRDPIFMEPLATSFGQERAAIRQEVDFICAYTGIPYDAFTRGIIVDLISACANPEADREALVERLMRLDQDFLYFYYAHGN